MHDTSAQPERMLPSIPQRTPEEPQPGTEKEKRQEVETRLAQQMEETIRMTAALAQVSEDLESKICKWEEDRSHLLTEQVEESSRVKAVLSQAQEDLDDERRHQQEEKSCLLESIRTIQRTLDEKEGTKVGVMERVVNLEKNLEQKKLKRNWRKRFLQIFKLTGKISPSWALLPPSYHPTSLCTDFLLHPTHPSSTHNPRPCQQEQPFCLITVQYELHNSTLMYKANFVPLFENLRQDFDICLPPCCEQS